MPVETWDARRFTPAQARAVGELIHQVWPKPGVTAEDRAEQQLGLAQKFQGPGGESPLALVVVEEGRVLAHAAMLPREILSTEGKLLVGGLSRVCTDAAARGRGLGEQVARAAFALVDAGDFDFALFQTSRRVAPFYVKLGAVEVQNKIVNSRADEPTASAFWDEVVMRYPAGGAWPGGTIDILGPGW